MKVIEFGNRNKKTNKEIIGLNPEVLLISNPSGASILAYICLLDDRIRFRFRRSKDNSIVADFDDDLNQIGELKNLVDIEEFNKAMELLREYKKISDYIDDFLEEKNDGSLFDKISKGKDVEF